MQLLFAQLERVELQVFQLFEIVNKIGRGERSLQALFDGGC